VSYVLERFGVDDVRALTAEIQGLPRADSTAREAQAVSELLRARLVDSDGAPATALARVYKTERYDRLAADLREFAAGLATGELGPDVRCLTLLGSAGDLPAWNDPAASAGHRAIPLPTREFVERLPMIDQLIRQLGVDVGDVLRPPPAEQARALSTRSSDVFHVPEAAGSPFIPAQDFVAEHGIRSAVGFGGIMLSGDFFAAVLFAKVPVGDAAARTLKILAHPIRLRFLPFAVRLSLGR
jgi:hypothetical protein